MKIRFEDVLKVRSRELGDEQFAIVAMGDPVSIRVLSKRILGVFGAENYGGEVVRRYNRRHDCEEGNENR